LQKIDYEAPVWVLNYNNPEPLLEHAITRNDSFISGTEFTIELKLDENGNYIDYL
jgi:hypothetical protein